MSFRQSAHRRQILPTGELSVFPLRTCIHHGGMEDVCMLNHKITIRQENHKDYKSMQKCCLHLADNKTTAAAECYQHPTACAGDRATYTTDFVCTAGIHRLLRSFFLLCAAPICNRAAVSAVLLMKMMRFAEKKRGSIKSFYVKAAQCVIKYM